MINVSNDIKKDKEQEESSVYSDACSNSLEIQTLNKKEIKERKNNFDYNNNNKIDQKSNNNYKRNNYKSHTNKNAYRCDNTSNNNINNGNNITSSFSISDTSFNNRRGSSYSINSTKSSLFTKNINFKKIKIDIPKKGYLNNRYIINNKQLLTPIEEKDKGSPSILSCENKKQMKNINLDDKGLIFTKQSLDPVAKKFIFSPDLKKEINEIKEIKETKNDNNEKGSNNSNNSKDSKNSKSYLKKKLFQKPCDNNSENEDNEDNDNNINLDDIMINEFNFKTNSKEKNIYINRHKNKYFTEINRKYSCSNPLFNNEFNNYRNNYSFYSFCGRRKSPSLNSTLNIKRALKFDKITNISGIDINNIKQDEIDLDFLKKKLRTIPAKIHKISNERNRYIRNLIEIQNFFIEDSPIWIMKMSHNYEHLATGSKSGSIKIFNLLGYNSEELELIYNKNNVIKYFRLISEKPILQLNKHTKDIVDLSWSPFNFNLLLSASLDHYVILWDVSKNDNNIIKKFDHKDIITCISFSPTNPNVFITGCFDRFIRIFTIDDSIIFNDNNNNESSFDNYNIFSKNRNINILNDSKSTFNVKNNIKNKINTINSNIDDNNLDDQKFNLPNYFNIDEIITSVAFFPEGNKIAIGTHNGKILVYNIFPKVSYAYSFVCRNRLGKYSGGKKVSSIIFTDRNKALITTADSRIRYISMIDGKLLCKYKGHNNLNSMIRGSPDLCNDYIISGSENNFCYIWSLFNRENKEIKNYRYEYFRSFSRENIYCSLILPEFCYVNYIKKIYKYTTKINIFSVIVNATDNGRLQVLLNAEEN